ncbi:MarR family winged helix-turn-helix transcriptional regulator [Microbulbifer sp. 2205BS26-8]|uniref:MarR family winged helix-turn-helix transcriptional regulator n=1 Tax=Microbulbifer sp. 2205BS26-8 TaxID=3064386 RepID=UPI00273E0072|nr:MarR family transcriptional regulator [Microbulbifer sp. 2205BS26-8]MDP5208293.1 MarR family transcriptional regulator [Microbulbifer sp. 2205BS26-8]
MKRTIEGEALTALILETFRLNGVLLAAGNKLTKPMGMTSARWQVMGAIDEWGQPLTVAQIARRMGLARQGVQRIVNDLEDKGLVTLEKNLDHKRSPFVTISEAGYAVMIEIGKAQAAWVNALAEGLSEQGIRDALRLLEIVRDRTEQTSVSNNGKRK